MVGTPSNRAAEIVYWAIAFKAFADSYQHLAPIVQEWGQYLWAVSYQYGIIKRGLLGHIYQQITGPSNVATIHRVVPFIHKGLFCALFFLVAWSAYRISISIDHQNLRLLLLTLFASLLITPGWQTLAFNTGYPDLIVIVVAFVGFYCCLQQYRIICLALAVIGPLIHEMFLFIWPAAAILGIAQARCRIGGNSNKDQIFAGCLLIIPLLSHVAINTLHDNTALIHALENAGINDPAKIDYLYSVQFNQSVGSSLQAMIFRHWLPYGWNALLGLGYFCLIPILINIVIYQCAESEPAWRLTDATRGIYWQLEVRQLMVIGSLLPMAILLVAWDLSRMLCLLNFSTIMTLMAACHLKLFRTGRLITWTKASMAVLVTSIAFYGSPFLAYSYFERVHLITPGRCRHPLLKLFKPTDLPSSRLARFYQELGGKPQQVSEEVDQMERFSKKCSRR